MHSDNHEVQTSDSQTRVRIAALPTYSEVRRLLPILDGVQERVFSGLMNTIHGQTGTPQNTVDWTRPEEWIPARLRGDEAALGLRIWQESDQKVNPRYLRGPYRFINQYVLLDSDARGIYQPNDRTRAFLAGEVSFIRQIDELEGIPHLLSILATKPRAKRGDLLEEWGDYLNEHSTFGSPSTTQPLPAKAGRLTTTTESGWAGSSLRSCYGSILKSASGGSWS